MVDEGWVLAAPFRAHVRLVIEQSGQPWRVIAEAAGVPDPVVATLLHGRAGRARPRLAAPHARRLLAVTPASLRNAARELVPAGPTRAALLALRGLGWPEATLAEVLGTDRGTVVGVLDGGLSRCPRLLALAAAAAARAHGLAVPAQPGDAAPLAA